MDIAYRRLKAKLGGWFWLPCPRCGDMFAGYEEHGHSAYNVMHTLTWGSIVCKKHQVPKDFGYHVLNGVARTTSLYRIGDSEPFEVIPWDVEKK